MNSEEFKNYFKFPLIYKENFIYVLSNEGDPVLTWLVTKDDFSEDFAEIINKMNGYSDKKYENNWNIREKTFIYYGDQKIFLIRGCHLLTGNNKNNISHEKAQKLQTHFGDYIIEKLNK